MGWGILERFKNRDYLPSSKDGARILVKALESKQIDLIKCDHISSVCQTLSYKPLKSIVNQIHGKEYTRLGQRFEIHFIDKVTHLPGRSEKWESPISTDPNVVILDE